MAKFREKNKSIVLRKKGYSIGEIAKRVNVSKSIVSRWCRDIELTDQQIEVLHQKMMVGSYRGRMKALEQIRQKRKVESKRLKGEGIKEIGDTNRRDLFIAGIALYWAEGTKSPNAEETSFSNSNPYMINVILRWFEDVCFVTRDRFVVQVRINRTHKNRIKEVEDYWSKITGIPLTQFTKTILIESIAKKVYSDKNHYGTVRITVRKGTQLRRKIIGFIEGLSKIA